MKHIHIETRHVGKVVCCDICNEDSSESGGFLFSGYAYCPTCAKTSIDRIRDYGEEQYITEYCPPGLSFHDWVIKLRNGDNTIKIVTVDDQ